MVAAVEVLLRGKMWALALAGLCKQCTWECLFAGQQQH